MDHSCRYAILRVVPDPRRGEIVNIGIAVFHSQTVDVRLAPALGKVIALDPTTDIDALRQLPQHLTHWASRFDSIEEKYEAINQLGIVSLTELGSFQVTNALSYEDHILHLMKALILPKQKTSVSSVTSNRITTSLRQIFQSRDVLGKDDEDILKRLVVPNYPIDRDEYLFADFALMNGAYWITETADFRAKSNGRLDNSRVASFAAIKLIKAKESFEKKVHSFVVFATNSESAVTSQLHLLSNYADELINLNSKDAMARYTQKILSVAGANRQIPH